MKADTGQSSKPIYTERASEWLKTPNYSLGNQVPLKVMDTIEGMGIVSDVLGRIEYGVFA